MSTPVVERPQVPPPSARSRRRLWVLVVTAVAAVVAVVVVGIIVVRSESRPVPTFGSLAAHPDSTLHGTVAYVTNGCVRLVAAAGQPSEQVLCLPPLDPTDAEKYGKPVGPQLVWRPDGRLEVTMFRMKASSGKGVAPAPGYNAGWQKIVDVRTGSVEDVPAADVPSTPNLGTQPTVNAAGQQLRRTSDEATGRIKVTLTDSTGTRTLLSARGPGKYSYRLTSAFWAPDGKWVAADDGRILVITPTRPPVTRVLVPNPTAFWDFPSFAVTASDFAPLTADLRPAITRALDARDVASLQPYIAPSVGYAIAASGSFGTQSRAAMLTLMAHYLDTAKGPWSFDIPAATLAAYKSGAYERYLADDSYSGVSRNKVFVSVHVNGNGLIDQVFMAINTDLLLMH